MPQSTWRCAVIGTMAPSRELPAWPDDLPAGTGIDQTTQTTVTVQKGQHHYVYYGDHDIYFAPKTKTYYWRQDGTWKSGGELPKASRSYITTGGMDIDLDTAIPYERNELVIKQYKQRRVDGDRDRDHDNH